MTLLNFRCDVCTLWTQPLEAYPFLSTSLDPGIRTPIQDNNAVKFLISVTLSRFRTHSAMGSAFSLVRPDPATERLNFSSSSSHERAFSGSPLGYLTSLANVRPSSMVKVTLAGKD